MGCCAKEDSVFEVPGPLITGINTTGQFKEHQVCIITAQKSKNGEKHY
jgi:hypothetical protein